MEKVHRESMHIRIYTSLLHKYYTAAAPWMEENCAAYASSHLAQAIWQYTLHRSFQQDFVWTKSSVQTERDSGSSNRKEIRSSHLCLL